MMFGGMRSAAGVPLEASVQTLPNGAFLPSVPFAAYDPDTPLESEREINKLVLLRGGRDRWRWNPGIPPGSHLGDVICPPRGGT